MEGIQEVSTQITEHSEADAPVVCPQVNVKRGMFVIGGMLTLLALIPLAMKLRGPKNVHASTPDEDVIEKMQQTKKADATAKVDRVAQDSIGKDSLFDAQGNYLGPAVPDDIKPAIRKVSPKELERQNEAAITSVALPSGGNTTENFGTRTRGDYGGTQDPSLLREKRVTQKEEREVIGGSMLGYRASRADEGTRGSLRSSQGRGEDAIRQTDVIRVVGGDTQGGRGTLGGSPGVNESPLSLPGRSRSFTLPGELADMRISHGDYVKVPEGKSLECVLVNRIAAQSNESPVQVSVSRDFRSSDGKMLVPAGTTLLGKQFRISDMNQNRMLIQFNRMDFPNHQTAWFPVRTLPDGLDLQGEMGVEGTVKTGIFKAVMTAIALGAVEGLGAAVTGPVNINTTTGMTNINAGQMAAGRMADQVTHVADKVASRYLNMVPTIILEPGRRIRVYITEDTLMNVYLEGR